MKTRLSSTAALISLTLFLLAPSAAHADGAWLDAPPQAWNTPGMAVPTAPPPDNVAADPRCAGRFDRPPETAQDQQVVAAGWKLFAPYRAGWGITIVSGLVGYDGMCRPWTYQTFVFVDGAFAGTISPEPMASRMDGSAGLDEFFDGGGTLSGRFARYGPNDPLCCPSANSTVQYQIDRTPTGPVLVPTKITTTPTQR